VARARDLGLGNQAWSFAKQNSEAKAPQALWPALGARARQPQGIHDGAFARKAAFL